MDDRVKHALAPTADEIRAAATSNNARMAAELLGAKRGRALDVGCGDGKFTRGLAAICKDVTGVDIKERSIRAAQEAAREAGLAIDFQVASGEQLPFENNAFDVVAFSNSLHHIPHPDVALSEALRVLAPGGALYVMEPVPAGNYQEATRLVNDETEVRTEAYKALLAKIDHDVEQVNEVVYQSRRDFSDFDEWKADQIDRDEKRRAKFEAHPQKVRETFERNAEHDGDRLVFTQVFRVNLLRKS